jgi:hypothetical protein
LAKDNASFFTCLAGIKFFKKPFGIWQGPFTTFVALSAINPLPLSWRKTMHISKRRNLQGSPFLTLLQEHGGGIFSPDCKKIFFSSSYQRMVELISNPGRERWIASLAWLAEDDDLCVIQLLARTAHVL